MCPAPRSQLTQQHQDERSASQATAAPARVPDQRAHAGRHRPAFPLAPSSLADRLWGKQIQGRYWLQYTVTQRGREGRGLLREEYDYEAFSRPSGAIFNFFVVCLLAFVLCCLQSCVYKIINIVATNRCHTFGGGRLFVPASLRYRSFKYH